VTESTREVKTTTKTDTTLPDLLQGVKGLYKVFRLDPAPTGYLESADASSVDEEYLKRKWGGGLYELIYYPPPEAEDQTPRKQQIQITGSPKGAASSLPTARGGDPAVAAMLANINRRMDRQEDESRKAMQTEYAEMMKTQREQGASMLTETVAVLGTFQTQASERQAQDAKDREARWERAQLEADRRADRDQKEQDRRHDQAMERERAYAERQVQLIQAAHQSNNKGPLGDLEQLSQLMAVVEKFGSNGDKETLAQTVVKTLPGVMEGMANGYERAATAAASVRQQRRAAAPPPTQLPAPQVAAAPAQAPAPTRPPPEDDEATDDLPEGADVEWMESPEGVAFLGWLDYMDTLPTEAWQAVIMGGLQTGTLPAPMDGPMKSALAGDQEPLLQLFEKAGALDMLGRAMEAFNAGAGGQGPTVEPPSSPDGGLDVATGPVDEPTGPRPHPDDASADLEVQGPSGVAGPGDTGSSDVPGS